MPKMRRRNVGAVDVVADYYLTCGKRRNQPRIHTKICEESCRNIKKCVFYKSWFSSLSTKEVYEDNKKSKTNHKDVDEENFSTITKKKYYKSKVKKTKKIKKIKSKEVQ